MRSLTSIKKTKVKEYLAYYQEMVSWVLARANGYVRYLVEEALFGFEKGFREGMLRKKRRQW